MPTNQWSHLILVFSSNLGFKLHLLLVGLSDGLTALCTNCCRPEGQNVLYKLMNSTYKQSHTVHTRIYYSKVKEKRAIQKFLNLPYAPRV